MAALPKIIPFTTICIVGFISILGTVGTFAAGEAVVNGKAGPASALIEIQSLVLLMLEIIFMDKIPNIIQVIGFILGMMGGLFIAFQGVKRDKHDIAH